MKYVLIAVTAIVLIMGVVVIGRDNSPSSNEEANSSQESTDSTADGFVAKAQTAIERQDLENVVVMDVRTDEEWKQEHAIDAFHWGLAEHLQNGELPPIEKDSEIYVYCRTGNRSAQAITIMQDAGFTSLTNIGGLSDWKATGGETTNGFINNT